MKIGITLSETNYANYPRWIKGNNAAIEVIELSYKENNIQALDDCDAVVFTGGIDIRPASNEAYPHAPAEFNDMRDSFEMKLLKMCFQQQKPILGICRGLQLINLGKGGSLHIDNGEHKNKIHKKDIDDKIHTVTVEKKSWFYTVVQHEIGEVNSAHHQSIDALGHDLKAVAFSGDGIIEAIESANPQEQFILAVQWHPERMKDLNSTFSKNLRTALINSICN